MTKSPVGVNMPIQGGFGERPLGDRLSTVTNAAEDANKPHTICPEPWQRPGIAIRKNLNKLSDLPLDLRAQSPYTDLMYTIQILRPP
jgi:hypothetical protein